MWHPLEFLTIQTYFPISVYPLRRRTKIRPARGTRSPARREAVKGTFQAIGEEVGGKLGRAIAGLFRGRGAL